MQESEVLTKIVALAQPHFPESQIGAQFIVGQFGVCCSQDREFVVTNWLGVQGHGYYCPRGDAFRNMPAHNVTMWITNHLDGPAPAIHEFAL